MQLSSITSLAIFLVFFLVLIVFSLSPAIWIASKCQSKYNLTPTQNGQCIAFMTLFIAAILSSFLYF